MFRKRLVVIVSGVVLALAAATSASAQGRHAVGSAVKAVAHVVGISSDEVNQGNTDDGDVQDGNLDGGDQGNQGNADQGGQGNQGN